MPVAIRKRSWEDHVTPPRTGLQYSYDDLDLVCCHVQHRRGRCASMPECGHHQLYPWDDIGNGTKKMEGILQKFRNETQPNCEDVKGQSLTRDAVNVKSEQDNRLSNNVADQDELQCSALRNLQIHNGDADNKELNKDKGSSTISLSHPVPSTEVLHQTNDLGNVLKDGISLNNPVNEDCFELTRPKEETSVDNTESMVKVDVGSEKLVFEHMNVTSSTIEITNKPPASDSSADLCCNEEGQCCETSEQAILKCIKTDHSSKTMSSSSTSRGSHHIQYIEDANKANIVCKDHNVTPEENGDGIFKCAERDVLNVGCFNPPAFETSQLHASAIIDIMETWHDCSSKLQTIHEGSCPESGDDSSAQTSANGPEHPACRGLNIRNCENLTTSEDQILKVEPQPEGINEDHRANQNTTATEHEMVPKADGDIVKLRTRKVRSFTCFMSFFYE